MYIKPIFSYIGLMKTYKYIVIDTWNGEGYSYQNGSDLEYFESEDKAKAFCKKMAEAQLPQPKDSRMGSEVVEEIENGYSYLINQSSGIDDYGTYQYFELKPETYSIKISTNVNEVELLNSYEYEVEFQHCLRQVMKQTHIENNQVACDLSDCIKSKFFSAEDLGDDHDIQFRIIYNPLNT